MVCTSWLSSEPYAPPSPQQKDPSMSRMLDSLTNPSSAEQLKERMARIKEDPSLKPILDEIETGGPSAMMKYGM